MRQHLLRHGTAAALCAVAALALTACQGNGGGDGAGSSSSAQASTTASPRATTPPLLTGKQLTQALAPASLFSSGYAVDTSGTQDTGDAYQDAADTHPAKPDCTKLDTNAWIGITGMTGASFTQEQRMNAHRTAEVDQGIDVFKGSGAATALGRVAAISTSCPSFLDGDTRSKVTVKEKALPGVGDGAYVITLTSAGWQTGSTLVAVRVGTAVVSVFSGDDSGHDGSVTAEKVARHIAGQLHGKA